MSISSAKKIAHLVSNCAQKSYGCCTCHVGITDRTGRQEKGGATKGVDGSKTGNKEEQWKADSPYI